MPKLTNSCRRGSSQCFSMRRPFSCRRSAIEAIPAGQVLSIRLRTASTVIRARYAAIVQNLKVSAHMRRSEGVASACVDNIRKVTGGWSALLGEFDALLIESADFEAALEGFKQRMKNGRAVEFLASLGLH